MRILTFLLAASCFLSVSNALAQVNIGGTPASFQLDLEKDVPNFEIQRPNLNQLQQEDLKRTKKGKLERFAKIMSANISPIEQEQWHSLENGGRIWKAWIKAEGALATNLYFDKFLLPPGALLFVYNKDKTKVLGAFTSDNNHPSRLFSTGIVQGAGCFIELYEPAGVKVNSELHINGVGYAYRHIQTIAAARDFGDADACQVNVNCSEGNNYQDIKRSVTRILVKSGNDEGWCTGTVTNTVKEECKPYILTADHCGFLASASDISQWIFYFNYESPDCANPGSEGSLGSQSITGATSISSSEDGGGDTGSDFRLLELDSDIPESYSVYHSGWDRNNIAQPLGICIHHPDGDIKKISSFDTDASSTSFGGITADTHWGIEWAATANGHGVTEGGSSGSALFNNSGQIVGTLTGGSSFCSTPGEVDEFGKFSYSWESNGATADRQLKSFLDPDDTGVMTMTGKDCGHNVNIQEHSAPSEIIVYPNPSTGNFRVATGNLNSDAGLIEIMDQKGRLMLQRAIPVGSTETDFNLEGFSNGLYLVRVSYPTSTQTLRIALVR